MKKTLALLLALLMAASLVLTACSNSSGSESGDSASGSSAAEESSKEESKEAEEKTEAAPSADDYDQAEYEKNVYTFSNDSNDTVSLGTPETKLDPEKIYGSVDYIPEMFFGTFIIPGGDDMLSDYQSSMEYMKFNEAASGGGGVERQLTKIPYRIESTSYDYVDSKGKPSKLRVMQAVFCNEKGDKDYRKFLFTVDKKVLKLSEIKDFKYEDNVLTSYEEGSLKLEYGIAFKGTSLTLTKDGSSLILRTGTIDGKETEPRIATSGHSYLAEDSNPVDHIVSIDLYRNNKGDLHSIYITFDNDKNEEETSHYCCGEMTETGLFTFSVPYATETKTYQYVYFYTDGGLILTDGEEYHKYTYKEEDFHNYKLNTVLDEDVDAEKLSDEKQKELIATQNAILLELEQAFAKKKIDAQIDKETGRVSLDSNILFDTDSYELTAEGKKSLDEFLEVYTSVILSETHKGAVATIVIEGHTDTEGTDEYNQKLSENRAKAVSDYCIEVQPDLKGKIKTVGYAAKYPVYDSNGNVDMDASRRVVFKFKLEVK